MRLIILLFLISNGLNLVLSARILGLFPHPGKSHQIIFDRVMTALPGRGHHVTVATFFPLQNPPDNYTQVNLQELAQLRMESVSSADFEYPRWFERIPIIGSIIDQYAQHQVLGNVALDICEKLIKYAPLKEVLKKEYDLVIVETFSSVCMHGLLDVYEIKAPVVALASCSLFPGVARRMGAGDNPAYVPIVSSSFSQEMTYFERLENTILHILFNDFYDKFHKKEQALIERVFKRDIEDINALATNVSLILVNTHHVYSGVYPLVPGIVEIGGIHVTPSNRSLPPHIEKFVNEAKNGVILFSFGSQISSTSISSRVQQLLIKVFSHLKQRVIWKHSTAAEDGTFIGRNILRVKWLPQVELLQHPKVLALVGHGGLLGIYEAIAFGKPSLAIPIFADHKLNSAALKAIGVGEVLPIVDLQEENLSRALQLVLSEKIRQRARLVASMWNDRENPPMDTALFWIERVDVQSQIEAGKCNMHLHTSCFVILQAACIVQAARILGLFPHPGKSHQMVFDPLLKRLAERGHHLTVATFFPLENPPSNYTEISLQSLAELRLETFSAEDFEKPSFLMRVPILGDTLSQYVQHDGLGKLVAVICEKLTKYQPLNDALKNDYDLVIVERFDSACVHGLLEVFGITAPVIGISSCALMPGDAALMGADGNPAYVPIVTSSFSHRMPFLQRVENFIASLVLQHKYQTIRSKEREIIEKHYGRSITDLDKQIQKIALLFVNTFFESNGVYPLVPGIVEIGGIHIDPVHRTLPNYIKRFITESEHGVILFSFGSQLSSTSISKEKQEMFINAFSKLKERVLWKFADSDPEGTFVGSNILRVKWIPQNDLLQHPKVKAFICHGGMLGSLEAVSAGKPMIIIPIFADQKLNAAALKASSDAEVLSLADLKEEELDKALQNVLSERTRIKAELVSAMWHDRPASPLETAVFWTERVIRWTNQSSLYSEARNLTFYQYSLLDVSCKESGTMHFKVIKCLLLLTIFKSVESARILGLFQFPSKSHQAMFNHIMKTLAERGHHITAATFFPMDNKPENYTEINLQSLAPLKLETVDISTYEFPRWYTQIPVIGRSIDQYDQFLTLGKSSLSTCEKLISYKPLLNAMKEEYDVVIFETLNEGCVLSLLAAFEVKAPLVGISTTIFLPKDTIRMGADNNPAYVPVLTSSFTHRMSFLERLENFLIYLIAKAHNQNIWNQERAMVEERFGKTILSVEDIDVAVTLVNTFPDLNGVNPGVPGIIEIGGLHIQGGNKKLPGFIQKFLDEADDGVVIFSFGSQINSTSLSERKQEMFLNAFGKLKQRVLWKYTDSAEAGTYIRKNVLQVKWLPQAELIKHPKVKAMIYHGGMLGLTEAISAGKPLIIVPIFVDQRVNAATIKAAGIGEMLSLPDVQEEDIDAALQSVLSEK
ncbi:unnamed protein product [Leptosia nina]|uniref:Uncharacterized protein n=1 Tax=Leptosia nina TaxID=320188 RepID=A0AAV1IX86_9NEOP